MQFSLKSLFWLMAVFGFGLWILTLPQMFDKGWRLDPMTGEAFKEPAPELWPIEAAARIVFAATLFLIPTLARMGKPDCSHDPRPPT